MKVMNAVFPLRSTKYSFINLKITCREYSLIKNVQPEANKHYGKLKMAISLGN